MLTWESNLQIWAGLHVQENFSEVSPSPKLYHLEVIQLTMEHSSDEHTKFPGSSKGLQTCPKCTSSLWKCSPWVLQVPEQEQSWKCPRLWEQRCLTHTGAKHGLKYLKVLTRCSATMKIELMGKGVKELWGKGDNRSCRVSFVLHWLNSGDYLWNSYVCIT